MLREVPLQKNINEEATQQQHIAFVCVCATQTDFVSKYYISHI
jgi:hypothetical protein